MAIHQSHSTLTKRVVVTSTRKSSRKPHALGCSPVGVFQSARLRDLLEKRGVSQSQLARRIGVTQQTISKLVTDDRTGSKHIHKIARELLTTPAYLMGEIDDPDADAPPPPPAPMTQVVVMPVVLPTEDALARAFEGVLAASRGMNEAELARELAKRLPTMFALLRGALASDHGYADVAQDLTSVPAARQQA